MVCSLIYTNQEELKKIYHIKAFDVMTTSTGSETGEYIRPSKGALEYVFFLTFLFSVFFTLTSPLFSYIFFFSFPTYKLFLLDFF